MKALTTIGDRLLARLVPRAEARADDCQYVRDCLVRTACSSNYGKYERLMCAGGHVGRWVYIGCC